MRGVMRSFNKKLIRFRTHKKDKNGYLVGEYYLSVIECRLKDILTKRNGIRRELSVQRLVQAAKSLSVLRRGAGRTRKAAFTKTAPPLWELRRGYGVGDSIRLQLFGVTK